jgi:hypothetical protein
MADVSVTSNDTSKAKMRYLQNNLALLSKIFYFSLEGVSTTNNRWTMKLGDTYWMRLYCLVTITDTITAPHYKLCIVSPPVGSSKERLFSVVWICMKNVTTITSNIIISCLAWYDPLPSLSYMGFFCCQQKRNHPHCVSASVWHMQIRLLVTKLAILTSRFLEVSRLSVYPVA